MHKLDLLIAGVGGQGTILAGKIIAAAGLHEGMDVKTAETHGMAQRGGSVVTHVRLGEKVYSPLIPRGDADILLSFEQLEALRWLPFLSPTGTVITSTQVLEPLPVLTGQFAYPEGILDEIESKAARLVAVDPFEFALVRNNPRTVNTLLLGILARELPLPRASWETVMRELIPPKLLSVNEASFAGGWDHRGKTE